VKFLRMKPATARLLLQRRRRGRRRGGAPDRAFREQLDQGMWAAVRPRGHDGPPPGPDGQAFERSRATPTRHLLPAARPAAGRSSVSDAPRPQRNGHRRSSRCCGRSRCHSSTRPGSAIKAAARASRAGTTRSGRTTPAASAAPSSAPASCCARA
jgi:hypothetical protein